jgi:Putative metallopeptidase
MKLSQKLKAAAFRRGGFLLFVAMLISVASSSVHANEGAVQLEAAQREEMLQLFVLANVEFTILHEFGHALIHQFSLPVFGLEEDAADQIATTMMILKYGVDVDPIAIDRLLAVSAEWLSEWEAEREEVGSAHAFWDSHSLAIQRFYNVNCLLFGANPDELSFLLDSEGLPAERGFDCEQTYAQALHAVRWMVETYGRGPETMIPFEGIVVNYDETRDPRHEKVRQWIVQSKLAQEWSARATEFFPWPQTIPLTFDNCPGSADAYYNRNVGEIVICYELLDVFLERSENSLSRNIETVCKNPGLRRLFGEELGC